MRLTICAQTSTHLACLNVRISARAAIIETPIDGGDEIGDRAGRQNYEAGDLKITFENKDALLIDTFFLLLKY